MTRLAWFALAAALAAMPVAAAPVTERVAVTPIGTRIPRWETRVLPGEAEAVRALRSYSTCTALNAEQAPQLLRTVPNTVQEAALLRILVRPRKACRFNGKLELKAYLFRGTLAEALHRAGAASSGLPASAPPAETYDAFITRLSAADRDGVDKIDGQILVGRWLGYCAAHESPAAIAALLKSEPSTPAEIAALRALRPTLDGCLFKGQIADLSAVAIRALLAEALYQRQLGTPSS